MVASMGQIQAASEELATSWVPRTWGMGGVKSDSKVSDPSDWWATFNRKNEHMKSFIFPEVP